MGSKSTKIIYNHEEKVQLNILLDKACYYRGENISGHLDIKSKYDLNQTVFNDVKAIFKITQFQQYKYWDDDMEINVSENTDIFTLETDFITLMELIF